MYKVQLVVYIFFSQQMYLSNAEVQQNCRATETNPNFILVHCTDDSDCDAEPVITPSTSFDELNMNGECRIANTQQYIDGATNLHCNKFELDCTTETRALAAVFQCVIFSEVCALFAKKAPEKEKAVVSAQTAGRAIELFIAISTEFSFSWNNQKFNCQSTFTNYNCNANLVTGGIGDLDAGEYGLDVSGMVNPIYAIQRYQLPLGERYQFRGFLEIIGLTTEMFSTTVSQLQVPLQFQNVTLNKRGSITLNALDELYLYQKYDITLATSEISLANYVKIDCASSLPGVACDPRNSIIEYLGDQGIGFTTSIEYRLSIIPGASLKLSIYAGTGNDAEKYFSVFPFTRNIIFSPLRPVSAQAELLPTFQGYPFFTILMQISLPANSLQTHVIIRGFRIDASIVPVNPPVQVVRLTEPDETFVQTHYEVSYTHHGTIFFEVKSATATCVSTCDKLDLLTYAAYSEATRSNVINTLLTTTTTTTPTTTTIPTTTPTTTKISPTIPITTPNLTILVTSAPSNVITTTTTKLPPGTSISSSTSTTTTTPVSTQAIDTLVDVAVELQKSIQMKQENVACLYNMYSLSLTALEGSLPQHIEIVYNSSAGNTCNSSGSVNVDLPSIDASFRILLNLTVFPGAKIDLKAHTGLTRLVDFTITVTPLAPELIEIAIQPTATFQTSVTILLRATLSTKSLQSHVVVHGYHSNKTSVSPPLLVAELAPTHRQRVVYIPYTVQGTVGDEFLFEVESVTAECDNSCNQLDSLKLAKFSNRTRSQVITIESPTVATRKTSSIPSNIHTHQPGGAYRNYATRLASGQINVILIEGRRNLPLSLDIFMLFLFYII